MNRIDETLANLKSSRALGLMTHVVVGYPTIDETIKIIQTMDKYGADFIELQIPFSDPLADGPTIMKACEESLANGTKVIDAFRIMKDATTKVDTPLLFMAYYNTVFAYGVKEFCRDAKQSGASGLIIPDLPPEEESEEHFLEACKQNNLYSIRVVSPSSTDERLEKNAKVASGFVYFTARQGTTGAKDSLDPQLISNLKLVRQIFSIPVAVGFGISKPEHMKEIQNNANIAVVGSAIINLVSKSPKQEIEKNIESFMANLLQK